MPEGTGPEEWTDEEIWDELARRLETADGWTLERGPVTQKSVTPMRSYVHEPMRYGRLFLAGDAAHIVPPAGAKGLNLAVGDVVVLARALEHERRTGSAELLDAYSATCLRRVWQAERFSHDLTTLLHRAPGATAFDDRLQLARLDRIATSRSAAADLAEGYTGLPWGDHCLRPVPGRYRLGTGPSPAVKGITGTRSVLRSRTRERSSQALGSFLCLPITLEPRPHRVAMEE